MDGNWASLLGLVRIERSGGDLEMELAGQTLDLVYRGNGEFSAEYRLLGLIPISVPMLDALSFQAQHLEGEDYIIPRSNGMKVGLMSEATVSEPDPAWEERFGSWVPTDDAVGDLMGIDRIELRRHEETGLYVITQHGDGQEMDIPVTFSGRDELSVQGYGAPFTSARAYAEEGVEYIDVHGLRFERAE